MHHRKRAVVVSTDIGSEHRLPSRQIDASLSPFSTADPKDDDIQSIVEDLMSIAIINPEHAKTIQPAIDLWTFTMARKAKAAIITWSLMMATRSTNRGEKYCLALASTQATDTSQHLDEELPTGSIGGKDNGEWSISDKTELEPRVPGVEEAFVLRVLKNRCWALTAAEDERALEGAYWLARILGETYQNLAEFCTLGGSFKVGTVFPRVAG